MCLGTPDNTTNGNSHLHTPFGRKWLLLRYRAPSPSVHLLEFRSTNRCRSVYDKRYPDKREADEQKRRGRFLKHEYAHGRRPNVLYESERATTSGGCLGKEEQRQRRYHGGQIDPGQDYSRFRQQVYRSVLSDLLLREAIQTKRHGQRDCDPRELPIVDGDDNYKVKVENGNSRLIEPIKLSRGRRADFNSIFGRYTLFPGKSFGKNKKTSDINKQTFHPHEFVV